MRTYLSVGFALIASTLAGVQGEVTYIARPAGSNPWQAESLFLGAGVVAASADSDVTVRLDTATLGAHSGRLFFVWPGTSDSLVLLFGNTGADRERGEAGVNIGKFPAGTPLVFQFTIVDSSPGVADLHGKKLLTGQNRPGIDERVSDVLSSRWAVAGTVDGQTVEVGFTDRLTYDFRSIAFIVKGAHIVK